MLRRSRESVPRRRRPARAQRQPRPRGDQGLGGARRPPASSKRRRIVFDDQDDVQGRVRARRARSRFRRGRALPGPARERHAGAAQADARRSACCRIAASRSRCVTDGRMSGASGKSAGGDPRDARGRRPAARSRKIRDGDIIRVDAVAGTLDVKVDEATLAARTVATSPTLAAHHSGLGRELFALFRERVGSADTGASVFSGDLRMTSAIEKKQREVEATLRLAPVVAVVVIDDARRGRAAGACAGRRRHPRDRSHVAHAGRARCDPRDRRRSRRRRRRLGHGADARRPARVGARRCEVCRLARRNRTRCSMPPTTSLLPWLPGAATASEAMALFERGYRFQKFFPAVPAGGIPLLRAWASPLPRHPVLPDRRDHADDRTRFSREPECRLRRWFVVESQGSAARWRLEEGRGTRARRGLARAGGAIAIAAIAATRTENVPGITSAACSVCAQRRSRARRCAR